MSNYAQGSRDSKATNPGPKLTFRLTQCYLELARAAATSIHHPEAQQFDAFIEREGHNRMANVIFSLASMTIIYSYLAIESFVNYQLYLLWKSRNDGSPESERFRSLLGEVRKFGDLRNTKARELGERIKALCHIFGFRKIHESDPQLWQSFKELVEDSRHFLIHPFPDPDEVQSHFDSIFVKTQFGRYVEVAQGIITHLYTEAGRPLPEWVRKNTFLQFRGVDLLAETEQ